jgi:N-methylhydantoinase A
VRIGVDIGGTFTDLAVSANGRIVGVGKRLTTIDDPARAVVEVVQETLEQLGRDAAGVAVFVHGTTLVANAIIERKGSRTALLTTAGFRDALEIARGRRYELYDLMVENAAPLVPRHLRIDVRERVLADGTVEEELDTDSVERITRALSEAGVEAIAISFLHSFRNPEHELQARAAVLRVDEGMNVSISSEVAPVIGEFERTSTTVANAYVQGLVGRYLGRLEERLQHIGFRGRVYVMLSNGGVVALETATRFPIRALESGPAAGALAAGRFGMQLGYPDLLSFDMGGTTAKLCVVEEGRPRITDEFEVDRVYRFKRGSGLPVRTPVTDMIEIGAGGGSIARIDALGLIKVGPDSAGALPGPACYGRGGTEPTVTDANVVLGYLDPGYFLGGRLQLHEQAAADAIDRHVARPLGVSVVEAAWAIHALVNESMATAARMHIVERGMDARVLPIVAFGGAGPTHAVGVARILGSPSVFAPVRAGVMSSVGFLSAPLAFESSRSRRWLVDELDWDEAGTIFTELEAEGTALLARAGAESLTHRRYAHMRCLGQGHDVRVELDDGIIGDLAALTDAFRGEYVRLFGRPGPDVPVEVLTWRVASIAPEPDLSVSGERPGVDALKGMRPAYVPSAEALVETAVYDRESLVPGAVIKGPAIVEEAESTLLVLEEMRATVEANLALRVVRQEEGAR